MRSLFPSRLDYSGLRRTWRADLFAGITVGIVALPLALAFGVSSGAGATSGLITAIVAGLIAAIFGGSHVQVSGPTGAMVVVLAPILATQGTEALAVVTLLAGLFVLASGMLRLGRAVSYIPWPVIEGFTFGIAVIIFLQQVPSALGATPESGGNAAVTAWLTVLTSSFAAAWAPLLLVAVVIAIMVVVPRIHATLPASIIGVVVAMLLAISLQLPVETIGNLPTSLPAPQLPAFDLGQIIALTGPALTVAALAAIESLLSARVAASMSSTGAYDADRELVGQGLASIASGLFGGMPATGAIARTAVNVRAGARTRASAIVHALLLLAVVYGASVLVEKIPLAALAGVLMVTAVRMVSVPAARTILRATKSDAVVYILTAIITVSVDLIYAVAIGMIAAGFFALRSLTKQSDVIREPLPEPVKEGDERIGLYALSGSLFFGSAERMLNTITETSGTRVVILRMSQLQLLDATGAHIITELVQELDRRGVIVLLKGLQKRHTLLARRIGVVRLLESRGHVFDSLEEAVQHAREHLQESS